jgi:type I restriction enzyme, S subunit
VKTSHWVEGKLGNLLQVKHGFAFLGEYFGSAGTHIVLTPGNFHDEGGFKEIAEKRKWYRGPIPADYVLSEGDVLVAMTEQAEGLLGSSATVPRSGIYLHNQRLGLIRIRDPQTADKRFLYYLFNSKPVRQQIRASASGTKIRHTAPSRIEDVRVSIPPLLSQRRIASILSAYDELIENSQRRIRILETMARTLYREWFVNFRFPGHEQFRRVPSALGEIPEGWEAKTVGDLTEYLNRGLSPTYSEDGPSIVINQKCIRDQRVAMRLARRQSKVIPTAKQVRFGDVLINSTGVGTLGRVAQVYKDIDNCTVDSHVTIARAKEEIDIDFFGCTLLSRQEEIERLGIGATGQTELSRSAIAGLEVAVPRLKIQRAFSAQARPIRNMTVLLADQIENLVKTRDLLLPRLLSGHIRIEVKDDHATDN